MFAPRQERPKAEHFVCFAAVSWLLSLMGGA